MVPSDSEKQFAALHAAQARANAQGAPVHIVSRTLRGDHVLALYDHGVPIPDGCSVLETVRPVAQ